MNFKRLTAAALAAVITLTSAIQGYAMRSAAEETGAQPSVSGNNMNIEGTNSFGKMFASELSAKQAEQLENNGCNIFSVEMDGTTATVSYQTAVDCTLVIGIYDESGTTLYATGTAEVTPDERETTVTIEIDEMPQYFYIKGYLADSFLLNPLCTVYECPNYTQEMQEFFAKTVDDFDEEKVINFDEDKTNNFAVYSESTIVIPENEGYNIVTSADDENDAYVIENADKNVLALQEGDIFAYEYGENELLIVKIGTIAVDGTTVTITGVETDMDEVFEFVRIETEGDLTDAEASANPEIVDTEEAAEVRTNAPSQMPLAKANDVESGIESSAELTFSFEGEYKKDSNKMQDTGKKDKDGKPIKRQVSALSSDAKINGSASFKTSFRVEVNISRKISNVEMEISYEGNLKLNASADVGFTVTFETLTFKLLNGVVTLNITPKLILQLQAEMKFEGRWWGSVGARAEYQKKNISITNISHSPQHSVKSQMEGSLYIGLNLSPQIVIVHEKIAAANMEGEIGIKLTQKRQLSYDSSMDYSKEPSIHDCLWCYAGEIYLSGKFKFNIKIFKHQSDDKYLIGSKDGNAEKKLTDYYWSLDHNELKLGSCPHDLYRVKFHVTDKDGVPISNATITFLQDIIVRLPSAPLKNITDSVTTGEDGTIIVFCPLDAVKFEVSAPDHETVTKGFYAFKNKDGTATPIPNSDGVVNVLLKDATYPVTVNVVDTQGNPISYARVYSSGNLPHSTGADGTTTIKFTKGVRSMVIEKRGFLPKSQTIDVSGETSITTALEQAGIVRFVVTDAQGNPVPDVDISSVGDILVSGTDNNGISECYPNMGQYTAHLSKDGYITQDVPFNYDGSAIEIPITLEKTVTSEALYQEILDMYCKNISEGWENYNKNVFMQGIENKYMTTEYISEFFYEEYYKKRTLSEVGYQLIDLDRDGTNELIVGTLDGTYDGFICDLYTIRDGKVVQLAVSGERDSFSLAEDMTIKENGNGTASASITYYRFENGELHPFEEYEYDAWEDEENRYLYSNEPVLTTDDYQYYQFTNWIHITEEEYRNQRTTIDLELTPFSEYAEKVPTTEPIPTEPTPTEPEEIEGKKVVHVSLGNDHSAAITEDGSLYMWGDNSYGQLGDGTTTDRYNPVKVMDNVTSVSLRSDHSAAITTDGCLYTWGDNYSGQLGDGTTTNRSTPVKIMDNVVAVSLGSSHSAAITTDDNLYTWGNNWDGQLGDGTTEDKSTPVKIMENVASVSLGDYHSAAITTDGSLYTWGNDWYDQLGNGTATDSLTPKKIMENVASVSLGWSHSAAITTDGSLYTWGENSYGQLGDGTTEYKSTPVKIMDNVASISLSRGGSYSAAITTDGSLYMWGSNQYGVLGDGTTEDKSIPVKIMDNVAAVSLGRDHSAAITTDGSLYTWGSNSYGQLGDGTTDSSFIPVKLEFFNSAEKEPYDPADGYTSHTKKTYNGHTYQLFDHTKLLTWTEAKAFCEEIGGHLVTIGDADEQQVIEDMFSEATLDGYWIGLYLDDNQWQWIDGTEFSYTNWDYDQMNEIAKPDNNSGDEQYGSIYAVTKEYTTWIQNAYKWDDTADDEECVNGIICEWDKLDTATVSLNTSTPVTATSGETTSPQTSLTDLIPDTVYNYYILYSDAEDKLLTSANIQYITQFVSSSDGTAEIDTGETPITEDAVMLTIPAVMTADEPDSTLGDVNGDGTIDTSDAAAILVEIASLGAGSGASFTDAQLTAADINQSGALETSDAAAILSYIAALGAGNEDVKLEDFG